MNNNSNTKSRKSWFSHLGWKRGWGSELSLKIKVEKTF